MRCLLTILGVLGLSVSGAAGQPNILFIFSDDHRADGLGVVNPKIRTPALDSLAADSVRFERAYAATAICSPSRAAVLSGRYGSRNGVATLSKALKFPRHTFARYLRDAGYRTAHFGKWHLRTTPAEAGFENYAIIHSNGSWFHRKVETNIPGVPKKLGGVFYEKFMADQIIRFLDGHTKKNAEKPFVLWWCNQVPHLDGKLKYPDVNNTQGSYRASDMAVPGNWRDSLKTKPAYLGNSRFVTKSVEENYGGPGGYLNPAPGIRNATAGEDNVQQHLLEYYASITALDAQIGRVLDRLEDPNGDGDKADSIVGSTWIVFMGDNGWQTGHHKFTSKVLAYEESARVPLLVKGPGIVPRVEGGLVLNIDLTPLFLDIAGVSPAKHHQGRNLRNLINNPAAPWRTLLYYEATTPEPSLGAMPHDSIRDERFKLIRTYLAGTGEFEELYDLKTDPGEMRNLADDPSFAGKKASLVRLLKAEKKTIADSPDPVE